MEAIRGRGLKPDAAHDDRGSEVRGPDHLLVQNARAVAGARALLSIGNALVLYLDPSVPPGGQWYNLVAAYGTVALIIAYSLWVWRQENSAAPLPSLPRLTVWLDVSFSAILIVSTGAYRTPFYMWFLFTIVASALQRGWQTAIRVCAAQIVFYAAICLPYRHSPHFVLAVFLTRTTYLFVIALVLAHMGQRLLEQNRMLAGLHSAAAHMSAGGSSREILGRIADSLTDLLEVEQVLVAGWREDAPPPQPVLVNLDEAQGEQLLALARSAVAEAPPSGRPYTVVQNAVDGLSQVGTDRGALTGIRNLLITRLSGTRGSLGLLVAANRRGQRRFAPADRDLAELLAAQAGPLLEACRLQEQRRYSASIDERRRIAGELHDRLIQTLASMDLRIVTCSDRWRARQWDRLGEELDQLKELAEQALAEARGAINELAPVQLREEGLAAYLEECVRQFQQRTSIPVEATVAVASHDVPEPTALLLISMLREGLNNIRKHAQAHRVRLEIVQQEGQIRLRLADDGIGFRPEQRASLPAPLRHYGLAYLRERITAMDGELQIHSRPGAGTILEVRVPLLSEEHLLSMIS
jgi:signal transduction histidine kinase